mmetsp:Transcript_29125/g.93897  ORF Transcript_29125/g.93897 Transcript_29125/m.93897 type:complete len:128 (+) Transcript_29125:371-754(+)
MERRRRPAPMFHTVDSHNRSTGGAGVTNAGVLAAGALPRRCAYKLYDLQRRDAPAGPCGRCGARMVAGGASLTHKVCMADEADEMSRAAVTERERRETMGTTGGAVNTGGSTVPSATDLSQSLSAHM